MTITNEQISTLFRNQQKHQWTVRDSTADERVKRLRRLRAAIEANAADITEAIYQDMGRPREQGGIETGAVLGAIDDAIANLKGWMAPTPVATRGPAASGYVRYEAKGVVLLFSAWNFPISLLFDPLVPMIAAGNTAIVKPSELAPASSRVAAKIIREAFEETEVAVAEGGAEVAEALLELPFDHIFFTGSSRIGRRVMAAAAKHLSSVTLELGGKCPAIIDKTVDLDTAVAQIAIGKTFNGGQVCLSVDYVMVPNSLRDEFVKKLGYFLGNEAFRADRTSRVINERGFKRIKGYLDDAIQRGATVAIGGGSDAEALTIEPTVLLNVPPDAEVMHEEIFGPLLPVIGYDELEEVVTKLRSGSKPLATYLFSKDDSFVEKLLASTSSGGVTVNGWSAHYMESEFPFGGVGDSGMGSYHGVHGFRELSHARAVAYAAQQQP